MKIECSGCTKVLDAKDMVFTIDEKFRCQECYKKHKIEMQKQWKERGIPFNETKFE